jgi:hypothetical protein
LVLLLTGNPLADEHPSAAASAAVGTPLPAILSLSQDLQKARLDLLVLADHPFLHPLPSPHRNLAGNLPAFFPDEPRASL